MARTRKQRRPTKPAWTAAVVPATDVDGTPDVEAFLEALAREALRQAAAPDGAESDRTAA